MGFGPSSVGFAAPEPSSRVLAGHAGGILALAFAPGGRLLASGGEDQTIRLWNVGTGREAAVLRGHTGPVRALGFSPDGQVLVSGSADSTIRLWTVASSSQLRALTSRFAAVRAVGFAPDGQWLATAGDDGSLRLWEWRTGKEAKAMRGRSGVVFCLGFAPDGAAIATGGSDGAVRVWDVASGRERAALSGHAGAVRAVAFAPVGQALASAGADGTIRLWDLGTARERRILSGHRGEVNAVAFAPDGRTLASAGADGTVRLWDVSTGTERTALAAHAGPAWTVAFAPDGSAVASGGQDRSVRLQPPSAPLGTALAEKVRQRGDEIGPSPSSPPLAEAALAIRPIEATAGSDLTLALSVTNRGKGPLYRLQGRSRSRDPVLDGQVFYLGKIEAGGRAEDVIRVAIPRDRGNAAIPMRIEFEEHNGFAPPPLEAQVTVKGLPGPRFAYTYQIVDDGTGSSVGNGDGRIQKGEAVDLVLTLKNVGSIAARDTRVEVTTPPDPGLVVRGGAVSLGILNPAETRTVRVNLFVRQDAAALELPLRLFVRETGLNVVLDNAVKLALDSRPPPTIVATNKLVVVKQDTSAKIHSGAGVETSVIASAAAGQPLAVTGELGEWYRLQISDAETGWIAKGEVAEAPAAAAAQIPVPQVRGPAVVKLFQNAPPVIALASPSEGQEITADRVQLVGAAASEKGIARLEVRINGQVLAQREGRGIVVKGTSPQAASNLEFSERVPLREGRNEVSVTAFDRESGSATRTVTLIRVADRGKIWAVVVGISQYKTVRSLKFADKDAQAFSDYLLHRLGVPREQITLLINEQATLFNLKRSLGTDLRRRAGPADTVIIYYAGHGAPESDATSLDDDGVEKYLVPHDADPNDLYATALPMREIETILQRLAAERVIIITDSCFSGATAGRTFVTAARRATLSDGFLARLAKARGRVVLTASRATEVSEERDALGHGVFTYYLMEGLNGKADLDGDGIVSVDEVYRYVSAKVPEVTGQNQHPMKKGEVEGQLVLGRVQ